MNRLLILPVLLLTLLVGTPAFSADYQKGLTAADKGDYATALREWMPLAEQGNAAAQYNLGWMYNKGQGVPQDSKTAVKWWTLAAEQGNADAQFNLGVMYDKGQGVSQDYKAAVNVPGFSARPPTTPTERRDVAIGPVDHTRPKWATGIVGGLWSYFSKQPAGDLRPGSSAPPPAGTKSIPGATGGGATTPLDPKRPMTQPLPPIDSVNGKSAVRIEDVPGAIGSLSPNIPRRPTTPCIPPTPCVPQDYKTAVKWYRLAAEQGNANAQNNLGVIYVNGQGVPQDNVYAHMWLNIAAASGDKDAVKNRDIVAGTMTPADISEAQKLARECVRKKYKGC